MTQLAPHPVPGGAAPLLPRAETLDAMPLLILYPHARCNCRCVMCDIWKGKEPTELDVEAVRSWLPELSRRGTRRVVLSGGEALMHSRIRDLCALLHGAGLGITLLSSGLLLARDAAWLPDFVDDLVVSLDGPPAVHDAVRNVPRAFDRLAEGVRAVRARAPELAITARCTVQRANAAHLVATARAARDLGFSRVSFLAADLAAGAFARAADAPDLAPDPDLLAAEVAALVAAMPAEFLAEPPEKLRRALVDHFRAVRGELPFAPRVCNAPFVSAVIESDGAVRPCFFQPPIGNVRREGFAALDSERARAFRRGLDVSSDPVCARCVCSLALREEP